MSRQRPHRELTKEDWKKIRAATKRILYAGEILKHERQDIEQELAVTLWKESRKFKSRQSSWASFSYLVLEKHLRKIMRHRTQPTARYRNFQAISLNTPLPDAEDSDAVSELIEQVNSDGLLEDGTSPTEPEQILLKMDMDEFMNQLPENLRKICDLLKIMRIRDVSKILKISRTTLYKRINEIKKEMNDRGLTSYSEANAFQKT